MIEVLPAVAIWPPEAGVAEGIIGKPDFGGRMWRERHGYGDSAALERVLECAVDQGGGGVLQLGADMDNGGGLPGVIGIADAGDVSDDMRVLDTHAACGLDRHLVPDAGIAIGYGLDPVPTGYILVCDGAGDLAVAALAAVGVPDGIGGIDEDGETVLAFCRQCRGNIIALAEKHAVMGLFVQVVAIEPDLTAIIDAAEV